MDFIKVSKDQSPHIALIELNRPKEFNAINLQLLTELSQALKEADDDEEIRVIVLNGNEKAFAAGADIKQLADKGSIEMMKMDLYSIWSQISSTKKPVIAAVSGFALGGGCELALSCDMIIASETAQFGQPEIKIGVMPGAGGTQRLTKAVGKAKAMEMVLTGKFIDAEEAMKYKLINKIVPVEVYLKEAFKLASEISAMAPIAVRNAKESINKSYELGLTEGLSFERKNYNILYSTDDQKEGMNAFIEKRKPDFKGQ